MMQSVNNVYVRPDLKHAAALKASKQAKPATKSKARTRQTLAPSSVSPQTIEYESNSNLNVTQSRKTTQISLAPAKQPINKSKLSAAQKARASVPAMPVQNEDLGKLTPEEKRQRRLLRNRLAAKECRRKKKLHILKLEEQFRILTLQNEQLKLQKQEIEVILFLAGLLTQANAEREVTSNESDNRQTSAETTIC